MSSRFAPDEQQRLDELLDAAADAVEAWAREGTSKAANRFNTFQLREADLSDAPPRLGEVDGPPDETASAARRPAGDASCPGGTAHAMPESSTPPLRGRRGRDRRIAEKVAGTSRPRHAPPVRRRGAVDFDTARSTPRSRRDPRPAGPRGRAAAGRPPVAAASRRPGAAAPVIAAPGPRRAAAAARRDRHVRRAAGAAGDARPTSAGRAARRARRGAARREDVPRRDSLAGEEPLVWVARDAEIGDRVAEELGAWLGDPAAVAVLEPRTALAYERSELVADETAARVAALAAWRSGRARVLVASVQALSSSTRSRPDDLPAEPRELRPGPPPPGPAPASCSISATPR